MEYKIPISNKDYYKAMLMVLNFNLKLSELEMDILCTMLNNGMYEVNIDTREVIRKVLDKDKFMTNNYIKRLRNKQVLLDKQGSNRVYYINPIIMNIINDRKVSFEFNVINLDNENNTLPD
jgi:hypothetical protein